VEDIVFCPLDQLTFEATGTGVIFWYDSLNSVTPADTGNYFTTPVLSESTSYFVEQLLDSCYSERIEVKAIAQPCDDITVPNVFSPNGDGLNDFISFFLMDATCFEMDIYNRWGYAVFHSGDPQKQWNGESDTGEPLSEGVYFWVLHYCPKNVPPKTQHGFIHLFK
jgi:gliding motility-associated-like protein